MNQSKIDKVKAEARRFLAAIEAVERHARTHNVGRECYFTSPKHTGAARRASMDLTRALADLRRCEP